MGRLERDSPGEHRPANKHRKSDAMDAIKKKMQAMKIEKDNAMDRADACEQAAKDAKVRAAKAEEEVADLVKKAKQLEVELDKTTEELLTTTEKLKEKENALLSAELFRVLRKILKSVKTNFSRQPTNLTRLLLLL